MICPSPSKGLRRATAAAALMSLFGSASAATFVVANTADSGAGSLRQAIADANANAGADVIEFAIPGGGPHAINTATTLLVTGPVTIDGTTQPGYAGSPQVELIGPGVSTINGLDLRADGCVVKGLAIGRFRAGLITTRSGHLIVSNYFGLRADGATPSANTQTGIELNSGSNNVQIGLPGQGNIFTSSAWGITSFLGSGHKIQGNRFGTDPTGMVSIASGRGMSINTSDTIIGGSAPGEGNQFSCNLNPISLGNARNEVLGNTFGLDATGVGVLPSGVAIVVTGNDHVIGRPGAGNIIANSGNGIQVQGARHTIQSNVIGFNAVGANAPTLGASVQAGGFTDSKIGGLGVGEGNFFGNGHQGITVQNGARLAIQGNIIGLNPAGTAPAKFRFSAVGLENVSDSLVEHNVISGSNTIGETLLNNAGLMLYGTSSRNVVRANKIGTDLSGTVAQPNDFGIKIESGAQDNIIGGHDPADGNIISGNRFTGIYIFTNSISTPNGTLIKNNRIGISSNGTALGNGSSGVLISYGQRHRISQNSIGYNAGLGIQFSIVQGSNPNNLQAFPTITAVSKSGAALNVAGSLTSAPNASFEIEFFASTVPDASLTGEGHRYLGTAVVNTNAAGVASFNLSVPCQVSLGEYITATATDAIGNTSQFSRWLQLMTSNEAPIADAGGDVWLFVPHDGDPDTDTAAIDLDGSASTDPDGNPLTFTWKEGSTVIGNTAQLTVSRPAGVYTFTLEVKDPSGAVSTDTVMATILEEQNNAPEANAGNGQRIQIPHDGDPNTTSVDVTLTGTASDPDGDSLTYEWRNAAGEVIGTSLSITVTVDVDSSFTFIVTDPYGAVDESTTGVRLFPEQNQAPTADAGSDQQLQTAPGESTMVVLLAGAGNDPDSDALTYEWIENGTAIGSGASVSVTRGVGTHTFSLRVTDPYGAVAEDAVSVVIELGNRSPVALASGQPVVTVEHDGDPNTNTAQFTLDASGSSDPDGDALQFAWSEGGSPVGNSSSLSLSRTAGTYTFELTVTDPFGASSTSAFMVTILAEPNAAPIVSAGSGQSLVATPGGTQVSLSGTALDPDGDNLDTRWLLNGGQVGVGASLTTTLPAGIHLLTLEATDPYGASASSQVLVTVQYEWSGFLMPIKMDNTSIFKLGSTVPVKFRLTGASTGATPTARIYVAKLIDGIVGTELMPETNVNADAGNLFRYDGDQFIFNWSTKGLSQGTWQIRVDLGDGNPSRTVLVSLK